MPEMKKFKEFIEEQKKSSIEPEYDTTRMNDAMRERMKKSLKRGNYTPIDDIDAYIDQFR
ncbi:MAG: hypothetical protein F4Z97_00110 [Gammaproteobacteria bacterium]|nr:hypothetical protein [Gammaproteobacteria bacterium]